MLGPVFHTEMLLGGRRGRQYWFRWFVAGLLILSLLVHYLMYHNAMTAGLREEGRIPPRAASDFAAGFVYWVLVHQFLVILLAGPVFTAGAVTDEKTRGTLLYLFAADLTAWEILIGKLLGRMYEVLLLLIVTLPFMCFVGVFGGVTVASLAAIMLSLLGPMFAVGAVSLLFSVWTRQTRDAVVGMFAVGGLVAGLWLAARYLSTLSPFLSGLRSLSDYFHPMHVAGPALGSGDAQTVVAHLLSSWGAWGTIGAAAFTVSVWRLRGAYLKQLENSGRQGLTAAFVPKRATVSDEPMLWKERHVEGIAPLSIFKFIPRWFALPAIVVLTVALLTGIMALTLGMPYADVLMMFATLDVQRLQALPGGAVTLGFFVLGAVVLIIGSLIVGIRCSGAISSEREKQTWEALLLTPLETPSLIRNKLWGILGAAMPYVLAYSIPALVLATMVGPPQGWILMAVLSAALVIFVAFMWNRLDTLPAFGVLLLICIVGTIAGMLVSGPALFLTWLMLLVTVMAMFYMGGAGLWCSVRCSSSWRSLLSTLGLGYLGGLTLWLLTLPVTLVVGLMLYAFFEAMASADRLLGTQISEAFKPLTNQTDLIGAIASCIVLGGMFLGVPWWFLKSSESRVSHTERTRLWKEWEEPRPRRRRRIRKLKETQEAGDA